MPIALNVVRMICTDCENKISTCARCGEKFKDTEKIVCFEKYHFCKECNNASRTI